MDEAAHRGDAAGVLRAVVVAGCAAAHVSEQRGSDAKEGVRIWLMAAAAIRDGSFDKQEQAIISSELGDDVRDKLLDSLSGCSLSEVNELVSSKLAQALAYYQSIAPGEYERERPQIEARVAQKFGQSDFSSFVPNFIVPSSWDDVSQ